MGVLGFDTQWGTPPNPASSPDLVWLIFPRHWPPSSPFKAEEGEDQRVIVEDLVQGSRSLCRCHRGWFQTGPQKQAPVGGSACRPPWGGEREGGFYQVFGCIWSQGAFIFPHSGLWWLTSHLGEWKQLMGHGNKQTRMGARETEDIFSSIIGLISVTWLCAERFGSGLSALHKAEVLLPWSCGMKGCGGNMGFMLSAVAVVSLGDRQLLLPLQTHFPTTVSQIILSDCFSTWAVNNTRAGIHLQSVFSFFSSGNGNEPVLSHSAHMHSVCLFWHSKTNHSTVLTKGSPWNAPCRKIAAPSLYLLCGGQCVWLPHLGRKVSNITQELNLHRNTSASLLLTCWCIVTSSTHLFWWLQKAQIGLGLQMLLRGVRVRMKKIRGLLALFSSSHFCFCLILLA